MANNIRLDEGSSAKYAETIEVSSGIHRQVSSIAGIASCVLRRSYTVAENVTCTAANTDYVMANAMASGTKYLVVYCVSACKVAMGAVTSSANGVWVGAGIPTAFPVVVEGVTANDKAHVQSPTAGSVVTFTSMRD